ncbi:hypothetical protein E2C01_079647 [Portunus trituberculatus]|uniref:Uncharacterized protein n=1 Tax=Portunus trituberculatus TaxID=210409 RepID=A0A5B7IQV5_PORTR|nr:hypothetical protein [Portunus trituberculatus]
MIHAAGGRADGRRRRRRRRRRQSQGHTTSSGHTPPWRASHLPTTNTSKRLLLSARHLPRRPSVSSAAIYLRTAVHFLLQGKSGCPTILLPVLQDTPSPGTDCICYVIDFLEDKKTGMCSVWLGVLDRTPDARHHPSCPTPHRPRQGMIQKPLSA